MTPKTCHQCFNRLDNTKPSVRRSDIPGAGNGLFAERDYKWNEFVCWYKGVLSVCVYSLLSGVVLNDVNQCQNRSYVYGSSKQFAVDGRFHFGDGVGRYINVRMKGKNANVRWGGGMKKNKDLPLELLPNQEIQHSRLL